LLLVAVGVVGRMQPELAYSPSARMLCVPSRMGMPFEAVTLTNCPHATIEGWFIPAEKARATLLFCRGGTLNMSFETDTLAFFRSLGLNVFVFDYRGFGRSTGKLTERGTYADARTAWDYLVSTRSLPPERIVLYGRAMGGAVAARLACEQRPAGLVIEAGYTSLPAHRAEKTPLARLTIWTRYDTAACLQDVACPVLIAHSAHDNTISFAQGKALFRAAPEPKRFLELHGYHGDAIYASRDAYRAGLDEFLDDCLEPSR